MNIFKQLIFAFTSAEKMASFRTQGIGKTILYVLMLMVLASIPISITIGNDLSKMIQNIYEESKNIPEFKISNGELNMQSQMPYVKEIADKTYFVISNAETLPNKTIKTNDSIAFVLLKTRLVVYNLGKTTEFPYTNEFEITKRDFEKVIYLIKDRLPVIYSSIIPFVFVFLTISKFIGITVLTLIGLTIKNINKKSLTYKQLWTICAYAVTLPTIFFSITNSLHLPIPMQGLLYWSVASLLVFLIIKEIREAHVEE